MQRSHDRGTAVEAEVRVIGGEDGVPAGAARTATAREVERLFRLRAG